MTDGCAGCRAVNRNSATAINHSEKCRDRMSDKVKEGGSIAQKARLMVDRETAAEREMKEG